MMLDESDAIASREGAPSEARFSAGARSAWAEVAARGSNSSMQRIDLMIGIYPVFIHEYEHIYKTGPRALYLHRLNDYIPTL
jgi:hypothetical protein